MDNRPTLAKVAIPQNSPIFFIFFKENQSINQPLEIDRILQDIYNPLRYIHNSPPHILWALLHLVLSEREINRRPWHTRAAMHTGRVNRRR